MTSISVSKLQGLILSGTILIDTRPWDDFAEGFIEKSIYISPNEFFTERIVELVKDEPMIVVANEKEIPALQKRIAAVGNIQLLGYLEGGIKEWKEEGGQLDMMISIDPDEFSIDYKFDEFVLIDVRDKESYKQEHVVDADHIPSTEIENMLIELDPDELYYIYGKNVDEAGTAASLLRRAGVARLRVVNSGFAEIKDAGIKTISEKKKT